MNTSYSVVESAEEWVEPEWVMARLRDPRVCIVDCSSSALLYEEGHLPGARRLDGNTDLLFDEGNEEEDSLYFFYLCLQRGISPDTLCVFYGDQDSAGAWKALRIFQRFGHRRVKILRGGREGWIRRGLPLSLKKYEIRSGRNQGIAEIVSVRCYSNEW